MLMFRGKCGRKSNRMLVNPSTRIVVGIDKPKHVVLGSWSHTEMLSEGNAILAEYLSARKYLTFGIDDIYNFGLIQDSFQ